jgi:hypothetical protein
VNNWYAVGELARQRNADHEREAMGGRLARAARADDAGAERPSLAARLGAAILSIVRSDLPRDVPLDHSLTDYPCRLPDGRLGRVAVVMQASDWTLVCRVA